MLHRYLVPTPSLNSSPITVTWHVLLTIVSVLHYWLHSSYWRTLSLQFRIHELRLNWRRTPSFIGLRAVSRFGSCSSRSTCSTYCSECVVFSTWSISLTCDFFTALPWNLLRRFALLHSIPVAVHAIATCHCNLIQFGYYLCSVMSSSMANKHGKSYVNGQLSMS